MKVATLYFLPVGDRIPKGTPVRNGPNGDVIGYIRATVGDFDGVAHALDKARPEPDETVLNTVPVESP